MSAIGRGLSSAGYAAADYFGKSALMDQQSDLDIKKAERLAEVQEMMAARGEQRKAAAAEEARGSMVKRIGEKQGELADAEVGAKRGTIESGITDRAAWTADQQAAVDQSLALDRKGLMDDPELRLKASVQTGDTSEKEYAAHRSTERRNDREDKKSDQRNETDNKRLDADAAHRTAALKAQVAHWKALEARAGGDPSTKEAAGLKLGLLKKEMAWREKMAAMPANDPNRAKQMQVGIDMGWVKNDDPIEKVTEYRNDEFGNRVGQTERTVRRGAGAPASAPPAAKLTIGMEVDGFVFQGGDPKNKANWTPKGRTSSGTVK